MHDKILEYLRRCDSYVSGEELSHKLKITRSAIWKNIHVLIDNGYEIIAVPHLGYKLAKVTHKLLPAEIKHNLHTVAMAKEIFYFESLPSTMDKAMQLALEGAHNGTLVVAESQTKGRGRLGREWLSPKYKGIYFSLVLRPNILPQQASVLTMVIAVAVAQAIQRLTAAQVMIKWPNDILLNAKKLAGLLVEMNAEVDVVKFVIVGVGINVNVAKEQLPAAATSLKEEGFDTIERCQLIQEILRMIEAEYKSFLKGNVGSIIEKWREYSSTLHSRVRVTCHKEAIEGEAVDIDMDGGLLVRKDSGFVEKVMAGDVVSLRRL
jgi:BirA family biotin operon repressor/biotin-[acetyl-CoA-carboxylase] ligase